MEDQTAWDAVRKQYHFRCPICRQPEKVTGMLLPLRLAGESGTSRTLPLCPIHHAKFQEGFLTAQEVKKLGITWGQYEQYRSVVGSSEGSDEEKALLGRADTAKKVQKAAKKRMPKVHSDYIKLILYGEPGKTAARPFGGDGIAGRDDQFARSFFTTILSPCFLISILIFLSL